MLMYRLPEHMRAGLRKPLGRVFSTTKALVTYLRKTKFSKLVGVGDICAKELIVNGVIPDVVIIDRKTRRKKVKWDIKFPGKAFKVKNRPSTISDELLRGVRKSSIRRTLIDVKGEEDLAVLPVIKYCPVNSIVVYGLWFKGVVAVKANNAMKNKINRILEKMSYEN